MNEAFLLTETPDCSSSLPRHLSTGRRFVTRKSCYLWFMTPVTAAATDLAASQIGRRRKPEAGKGRARWMCVGPSAWSRVEMKFERRGP